MNILFILPEYYPHSGGGISTYYLHFIKALKSNVNKISVMVGSGYTQSDDTFNIDGIEIEYLKPNIFQRYKAHFSKFDLVPEYRNNLAASWAMWEQCKKGEGFDIVECVDFGLGFVPWICEGNLPVITRLHGSTGQIQLKEVFIHDDLNGDMHRHTEYILLGLSNELVTHSNANKKYWETIFTEKKINLIYPIYKSNLGNFASYNEKENVGIVCARIQEWKGPDVLCRALSSMLNSNIIINWYGRDTNYNCEISKGEQLEKEFPLIWGNKVIPKTMISNDELLRIQYKAMYAIIPSTWDMFNFTGLEYMSVGTPIICSDGAGFSELIEDGINGFKYDKNNHHDLANHIINITSLGSPKYEEIVENAKNTLLTTLDSDKLISENLKIYTQLLTDFKSIGNNIFIKSLYYPEISLNKLDYLLNKLPFKLLLSYFLKRIFKKLA